MKAVTYDRFGPAAEVLTLHELPTPTPQEGEVLVELAYSGVNPSDVKARAGARPGVTKPPFEQIAPHSDGSGVIIAVGEGVDPTRIGQQVYVWNGQWQRAFGTAASHICLPEAQATPLPDGCTLEQGAVLGIPGMTAAQLVFASGDVAGQWVLVQGGGGTVGYLAVQMAKFAGARVIATCSPRDFDRVRGAGAEAVFDYTASDLASQILAHTEGKGIGRVIESEFGANIDTVTEVVETGGRIMAYGSAKNMTPQIPYGPLMFKTVTIEMVLVYLLESRERQLVIDRLTEVFTANALQIPVAEVFDLAEAAAAHEAVEVGKRAGAVLVRCA